MTNNWLVQRNGLTIYADTDEHVSVVLRTLRIDESRWRRTVAGYAARWSPSQSATAKLEAVRDAYADATPAGESDLPDRPPERCPACRAIALVPSFARRMGHEPLASFAYTRCSSCGHGTLLDGRVPHEVYASPQYYREQTAAGVGYTGYAQERAYREAKGRRLFEDVLRRLAISPQTVVEVGSGFGYTRAGAHALGLSTLGVDLNPFAAATARELYGMETFVGTLGEARAGGAVPCGESDLVLYNFVLEHVADPDTELRLAASALRAGGALVLVIPSMDAAEVEVFGGSYRSFRADHLHIFSRRSVSRFLERAGLDVHSTTTTCNAHLLRGFLDERELDELYGRGEGPDMTVLAMRR